MKDKNLNKYLIIFVPIFILFGFFTNGEALAEGPTPVGNSVGIQTALTYKLLEGIPGGSDAGTETTDVGAYFKSIFTFGVGLAGALAVLMLVIAGIQYMSPTESAKTDAKDRATMAIFGLLLALGSVLLLRAINPDFQNIGFSTQSASSGGGTGQQSSNTSQSGSSQPTAFVPSDPTYFICLDQSGNTNTGASPSPISNCNASGGNSFSQHSLNFSPNDGCYVLLGSSSAGGDVCYAIQPEQP